ncbi:glycosyltransferase (plasmid) [Singulisphaera sp. Ch08]|uniref:Glycosyltransferase n=1 Tax=Singulisphaera sp. Ch08 TaxID=3120278 RepID=A0AAU7CSW7_9BACT
MTGTRVCHLGKYYHPAPGGIESHVRTLAHAQAELGLSVQVFCANHQAGPTTVETDGPIEVTRVRRLVSLAKCDVCPELGARLARIDADIIHLHVPNPAMVLGLLHARPGKPVVVTYHSDLIRQKFLGSIFRPIERLAYRQVRAIMTSSPLYPQGSSFLRPYTDRLYVLPHGVELQPYLDPSSEDRERAAQIRAQYASDGPLWLCAGRHVYYKGFVNAIRALTRVRGRLLLLGDGPDQQALRAEAQRLGVDDRVIFTGSLTHTLDLVPYYHAADAFWFPSNARSEAFGLVQVEAMASGCPVINTQIPHSGVAWVSLHEETGLTVPVDDPVALAAAANRLLTEPGLRDRFAAAAKRRAVREFDHRIMAERSLAIYRHVLSGAPVTQFARRPALTPSATS